MTLDDHTEELIYGFDPLCGWCFAFGPTMRALTEANPDLPVRLRYGGLVVGERVQPIAVMRDYLIQGLEQVRRTAGVAAGPDFYNGLLAQGTYISNSEPPCRAIYTMEQLAPAQAYAFAATLPDAFYVHGLPLDDEQVLGELVTPHGVDAEQFLAFWRSEVARDGTAAAFAQARSEGFNTYPTLLYRRGAQLALLGRGYLSPTDAVAHVAALRALPHKQGRMRPTTDVQPLPFGVR
jgi:putative protein-disulfide isomerase